MGTPERPVPRSGTMARLWTGEGARLGISGNLRRRPLQLIVLGFAGAVLVGTALLELPVSSAGSGPGLLASLFTATSAVCVTGLVVVHTSTAWSGFGQVVILALIQVGGFGIMTLASLVAMLVSRRLGLQTRLTAAASTRSVGLGDVRSVLVRVARVTVVIELLVAAILTVRWMIGYHQPFGRAAWWGVFHAVSAFNNAGFALWPDSLERYATDAWICLPIAAAVLVGGLGFPVLFELWSRHRRPGRWSLHTKLTMLMTAILVPLGMFFVLAAEWNNPGTLGALSVPGRFLAAFVQGVMPRTAGFTVLDPAAIHQGTWLGTDVLMFIGGGSASTAGGIKMTTFAVLGAVIWSELRGDPDVTFFDRRIAPSAQRQAAAVALVGVAAVIVPTIAIDLTSTLPLDQILVEVVSASATVGLSTGITSDLVPWHQVLLVVLMFAGRLGSITLGASLALRERARVVRRPEGAPLIG
ncbi:potassium transporter TrkG [Isoptericola sp. b441]|uniref:Potassium transporter TrkG n=1 Tax=Actinotalea lenta TaxID=3064654 RepID=A0ABT9D9J9_9CELL|nr:MULTISPECIES: potassium transporter TrkG [unclassified Isoptericola]MDO8107584.1 potassium transporter TrkG [Isoptericola sp. b441]MDO8120756.1 potassium transporter TrkG [Isoptericola sp. b490]